MDDNLKVIPVDDKESYYYSNYRLLSLETTSWELYNLNSIKIPIVFKPT